MTEEIVPIAVSGRVGDSLAEQIKTVDSTFNISIVTVIANKNSEEKDFRGVKVGPFEEGNQYEIQYWIAKKLVKSGIVFVKEEELLNLKKLQEEYFDMKVQTSKKFIRLERFFYAKARRLLAELKEKAASTPGGLRGFIRQEAKEEEEIPEDPAKNKKRKRKPPKLILRTNDYKYAENMVKDTFHCRRKKILCRIRDGNMTEEIMEKLTAEERLFYEYYKHDPQHINSVTDEYLQTMTEMIARPIDA